jgi:hypothetical protein
MGTPFISLVSTANPKTYTIMRLPPRWLVFAQGQVTILLLHRKNVHI